MKKSLILALTTLLLSSSAFAALKCKVELNIKDVTTDQSIFEEEVERKLKSEKELNLEGYKGINYYVRVDQGAETTITIQANNGNKIVRTAPANKKITQSLKLKIKEGELKFEEKLKVKCKKDKK